MRGITKQLSLLTAVVLLVGLLAVTASAAPTENCPGSCNHIAAIDTTHYDTLEEALATAPEGSTVTLLADMTLAEPLVLERPTTLDLGGKTLTGSVVFTADGSVLGGKIVAVDTPAVEVSGCNVSVEKDAILAGCGTAPTLLITASKDKDAQADVSGTLTGEGPAPLVEVTAEEGKCQLNILKKAKLTVEDNAAIAFDSAGKLEISGGTIKGKKDLITLQINKDRKTEAAITGGKLLSEEGNAVVITAEKGAKAPKNFVTGGTFIKVPSKFVPAYCVIRDNQDGTYTVISSYILTFQGGDAAGTMAPVKVKCGSSYTLPEPRFVPADGKDFAGWQIGGKIYAAGDSVTPDGDLTVTATWKDHVHTGGKATCLKKAVCSGCGQSYGKLGAHNLSYNGGYAPTCSTTGMNPHSKCTVCGSLFVDGSAVSASSLTTAALGHTWESVEGKEATCTEDGLHPHRLCSVCNTIQLNGVDVEEDALVIPATGHLLENVAASQATCSEPGIQAHEHCTNCDQRFLKDKPVQTADLTTALSAHVLSDWQSDETYHWKACVDCGEIFRQNRHTDTDADSICNDCGYALPPQEEQTATQKNGFPWFILIPIAAAAVIIPPIVKKRKNA